MRKYYMPKIKLSLTLQNYYLIKLNLICMFNQIYLFWKGGGERGAKDKTTFLVGEE